MPSAFREAISGVVGTLVSMFLFYPIDLEKTKIQARTPTNVTSPSAPSPSPLALLLRILKTFPPTSSSLEASYAGVYHKACYSVVSSFTFFFLLTMLKNRYKASRSTSKIPPQVNLALSCLAAMGNTFLTLPLDGLVVRIQTGSPLPSFSPDLWAGLHPALLLSSNPAIHYTVYDVIKSLVLASDDHADIGVEAKLSALSAFLVGLVAKSVATVFTYPLIHAKQVMITHEASSLLSTLSQIHKAQNISGLFQGLAIQLSHTVLKAALLMAIREKISEITSRQTVLYALRSRKNRIGSFNNAKLD